MDVRQSLNKIVIEGILLENTLEARTSEAGDNYITGEVTIRVGESDIPVKYYSKEYKKDGKTKSKVYPALLKLINIPSIADDGVGTKLMVSGGEISENTFFTDEMEQISYPELKSNFYKKSGKNYKEQATFEFEGIVRNVYPEIKDDVETGRLVLEVVGVNYQKTAVPVKFIIEKEKALAYIKAYYAQGKTVRVNGIIRYIPETIVKTTVSAFGDDVVKEYEKTTKEFVVTSGTEPYTDNAYSQEDAQTAMQNRNLFIESKKAKKVERNANNGGTTSAKKDDANPKPPQGKPGGFPF